MFKCLKSIYWTYMNVLTIIIYGIITIAAISYNLFQKIEINAIKSEQQIINTEQQNTFQFVVNKCLQNATKRATDLQYNKLNTAFIISGNVQQISKSVALLQFHINEWHGKITKIYLMADSNENEILKTFPKIFQLFPNKTVIISNNSTQSNIFVYNNSTNREKIKYIKMNTVADDMLIWLNYNNVFTETHCIYNKCMNVTIGSNDWVKHKTMHTTGWIQYRLGDIIKLKANRDDIRGYKYHKKHFPNSIAVQYMEKINKRKIYDDQNLLLKIISTRNQIYPLNINSTLVIHLRTGDVLEFPCKWKIHGRHHRAMTQLLHDPIGVFKHFLPKFRSNNISHIVLVTGFHTEINHTNSVNYMIKITQWFKANNFSVSFRINENPDKDFIFMCNSKFFIQSPGGFSWIIAKMVKNKNGSVFNFLDKIWFYKNTAIERQKCLERM